MMAIEKIVLLVIFVIILLVIVLVLFGIVNPLGEDINIESYIRQCCVAYRANDCQNEEIVCRETDTTIETLGDLARKRNMDENDFHLLKSFCNCCKTWNEEGTICLERW